MMKIENYAVDGRDFQISCKASAPIKKCVFQFEKSTVIDVLEEFKDPLKYSYVGAGFENGDCGIEIEGKWDMEEIVSCSVQLKEDDQNLSSNGTIIVDEASGRAILESNYLFGHLLHFNESQMMQIACRAQAGKYSKAKLLFGKHFIALNYFFTIFLSF
jgi:hypothetical protein